MKTLTAKSSFNLNDNNQDHVIPAGAKLNFVKETYHFYHAYYESHNYKALVEHRGNEFELRVHRVHGSKSFKLLNCTFTHGKSTDTYWSNSFNTYWDNFFEEECPLEIR